MHDVVIVRVVRRLFDEILELAIFFDLNEARRLAILVHRELRHHCTQPAGERAAAGVVCEFALLVAFGVLSKSVELGPDRACEILGILVVCRDLSRGGLNGRIEIRNEMLPCLFVASFAGNDQTDVIGADIVDELLDVGPARVRIIVIDVLT